MKAGKASFTARHVAAWRGLASFLPEPFRSLAPDPFGVALAGTPYTWLAALLARFPQLTTFLFSRGAFRRNTLYMAVRTRTIDDALRRFVRAGGRQVILLGAGLDARALRLCGELGAAVTFFEVDHPDSQAQKRLSLVAVTRTSAHVEALNAIRFVAHDFETGVRTALPSKLADAGFVASQRCFVVWEAVVMYLSDAAIADTVSLLRDTTAPGSQLAVLYIESPPVGQGALSALNQTYMRLRMLLFLLWLQHYAKEPMLSDGWRADELPGWFAIRGFKRLWDERHDESSQRLGTPTDVPNPLMKRSRIALLERVK